MSRRRSYAPSVSRPRVWIEAATISQPTGLSRAPSSAPDAKRGAFRVADRGCACRARISRNGWVVRDVSHELRAFPRAKRYDVERPVAPGSPRSPPRHGGPHHHLLRLFLQGASGLDTRPGHSEDGPPPSPLYPQTPAADRPCPPSPGLVSSVPVSPFDEPAATRGDALCAGLGAEPRCGNAR